MIKWFVRCKTACRRFCYKRIVIGLNCHVFPPFRQFCVVLGIHCILSGFFRSCSSKITFIIFLITNSAKMVNPLVCYLKRILSKQRIVYFSSAASLIDQPSVYCICRCICGGTPHCNVEMRF